MDINSPPVKYEDRIVAFLDILGVEELSKKEEFADNLMHILSTAKQTYGNPKDFYMNQKIFDEQRIPNVAAYVPHSVRRVTAFSDSIVISLPANNMNSTMVMIYEVASIHNALLDLGVLLRGGIAVGKIYHENDFVFGPALIAAYGLENDRSFRFPATKIDASVEADYLKALKEHVKAVPADFGKQINKEFGKDENTQFDVPLTEQIERFYQCSFQNMLVKEGAYTYVDYRFFAHLNGSGKAEFQKISDLCSTKMAEFSNIDDITSKWSWLSNQYEQPLSKAAFMYEDKSEDPFMITMPYKPYT